VFDLVNRLTTLQRPAAGWTVATVGTWKALAAARQLLATPLLEDNLLLPGSGIQLSSNRVVKWVLLDRAAS
jgi:hypothetical protein